MIMSARKLTLKDAFHRRIVAKHIFTASLKAFSIITQKTFISKKSLIAPSKMNIRKISLCSGISKLIFSHVSSMVLTTHSMKWILRSSNLSMSLSRKDIKYRTSTFNVASVCTDPYLFSLWWNHFHSTKYLIKSLSALDLILISMMMTTKLKTSNFESFSKSLWALNQHYSTKIMEVMNQNMVCTLYWRWFLTA